MRELSDRDEVGEETAALMEEIKVLKKNVKAKAAREEMDALLAEASDGGCSASEREAAARSSAGSLSPLPTLTPTLAARVRSWRHGKK